MYFGSNDNAVTKTWGDYPTAAAAAADGAMALRQKLSLLPHLVQRRDRRVRTAARPWASSTRRR